MFANHACVLVDFELWMNAENCGIGISVGREPIKREVRCIRDPMIQRFELFALKRALFAVGFELDDDALLLDVGDSKPLV